MTPLLIKIFMLSITGFALYTIVRTIADLVNETMYIRGRAWAYRHLRGGGTVTIANRRTGAYAQGVASAERDRAEQLAMRERWTRHVVVRGTNEKPSPAPSTVRTA